MHECSKTTAKRECFRIMGSLFGLVKPLLLIMLAAVFFGTVAYLCAIFLTILAGQVLIQGLLSGVAEGPVFL